MKVWGIIGWKNTGKTGLTERLVAEFCARGLRVSTIKHAHHDADMDRPGSDSYRHRMAGASEVILASGTRVAVMQELRGAPEPSLAELLGRLSDVDLVLIEGYKTGAHPMIETHRAAAGKGLIALDQPCVRAIASDVALDVGVSVLDLNDTSGIADFIAQELEL